MDRPRVDHLQKLEGLLCLSQKGYEHQTVSHTNFIEDPVTLTHIERQWREAKKVPPCGRRKKHLLE